MLSCWHGFPGGGIGDISPTKIKLKFDRKKGRKKEKRKKRKNFLSLHLKKVNSPPKRFVESAPDHVPPIHLESATAESENL
jgi:hypothetical protein